MPRLRSNPPEARWLPPPARAAAHVVRRVLPGRAARAIREGRVAAIMANDHLVTPALVRAVLGAGGELYVWTVDDAARMRALEALGVNAIITNDPRLFPSRVMDVRAPA